MPRKFNYLQFIILLCVISVLTLYLIASYLIKYTEAKQQADITKVKIADILIEEFGIAENFHRLVGERIAASNKYKDNQQILRIMRESLGGENRDNLSSFSWSLIDWLSADDYQVVNSKSGISPYPMYMGDKRDYIPLTRQQPGKLYLSKPAIGIPSGRWVIPAAMGVRNEKGEYIGATSMGFSISKLQEKISKFLLYPYLSYKITDKNQNIILSGSNSYRSQDFYTQPIKTLPYTVTTGIYPSILLLQVLATATAPSFIIIMLGIVIFMLLEVRKTLAERSQQLKETQLSNSELEQTKQQLEHALQIIEKSDKAKEEFIRHINHNIRTPLNVIMTYTELLLKRLNGETTVDIPKRQEAMLEHIYDSAEELLSFTSSILSISTVSIQKIIQDAVTIHAKEALSKKVTLLTDIAPSLRDIEGDALRLKQIMVGLLSHSMRGIPEKGNIVIQAREVDNMLRITIKDDGFGLTEEHLDHMLDGPNGEISRRSDGTDLKITAIEKLVRLHHGILTIESVKREGTTMIIELPYLALSELGQTQHSPKKTLREKVEAKDNVVPFQKKK